MAKVLGFISDLGEPLTVPIVTAAVVYDCNHKKLDRVRTGNKRRFSNDAMGIDSNHRYHANTDLIGIDSSQIK